MFVSSRIEARRRRCRTRPVTTLPDHVRAQLVNAFANVDLEGDGRVNRFKLVELVKEAYRPTDVEVHNVQTFFQSQSAPAQVVCGDAMSFEGFAAMFACVVLPVLDSLGMQLGWSAVKDVFCLSITQLARHGVIPRQHSATGLGSSTAHSALQLYISELQHWYEAIAISESPFLCEMVRQAFILPPKKLEQLRAFFHTTKDDRVHLDQFLHGMTLLYGDMNLLFSDEHLVGLVSTGVKEGALSSSPSLSGSCGTPTEAEELLLDEEPLFL